MHSAQQLLNFSRAIPQGGIFPTLVSKLSRDKDIVVFIPADNLAGGVITNFSMILRIVFLIILFCGSFEQFIFAQKYDFVKITAGKGIVFNNDSIVIGKTTLKETARIIKIPNEPEMYIVNWDGFNEKTKKDTGGQYLEVKLKHKSIEFSYVTSKKGRFNNDTLKLFSITIEMDNSMKSYTDNGIEMGSINPNIKEKYPEVGRYDYISDNKEAYGLNYYGITFDLKEVSGSMMVYKIKVFQRQR